MQYDLLVCPSCGNLRSECSDPGIDWHPRTTVCYATASREWGLRRLNARHADVKPDDKALHPLDGLSVFPSRIAPDPDEDEFA